MSYLHVRVVEAVGLPSTDLLGFADPYCKVFLQNVSHLSEGKVFKSEAKKKSTDPIFDCAASLNVSPKDFDNGLLKIDIYDRDKTRQTDELLGESSLPLTYFQSNKQFQGWLPIRSSPHKKHNKHNKHPRDSASHSAYTKPPIILNESIDTTVVHAQSTPKSSPLNQYINRFNSEADQDVFKRELSPEIQLLNGTGDIDAPPPEFPITTAQNNHNTNDDADPDGHTQLQSMSSITPDVSLRVSTNSPILSPLKENKQNDPETHNKQQQLAKMSEEFMKKPTKTKLKMSRSETYAHLVDDSVNKDEIHKGQTVNFVSSIRKQETVVDGMVQTLATNIQNHGRRNRESGRIFIVVHYQHNLHFGKMCNQDVKKTRTKNLKIKHEFTPNMPFTVYTLTFNAGNCSLSDFAASLPEWLSNKGNIDLYALGFQELNQTKNSNRNENEEEEQKEEKYENDEKYDHDINQQTEIEQYLLNHIGNDYVSVAHYKMWQTRLFLFTKKKFAEKISNVTSHFHSTGIGGIVRNKGAVAISLDFDGISLCFVSCHLAAHQTKMKERNAMYKKLCKNVKVGWPKQPLLGQFHFLFFMGDMNYRVNYFGQSQADKPTDELFQQVCQIIKQITISSSKQQQKDRLQRVDRKQITGGGELKVQNAYQGLLKHDQLMSCMDNRSAFVDFHEHHIKFPPSFKVKRQVGIHYISQRLPAWCDRILWRCPKSFDEMQEYNVKNYRIYDKVSISDHKPVSCGFVLPTWLRPCGISDDCTKAIIHFRNVSAKNLIPADVNGYSDPFIHFPRQLVLEKFVQSKRVNKTLNPKWKNKHLKPLVMLRNSLPFLQKALLLFQIRDHDKFSANDLIGCGCIELKYVVNKLNKWVHFQESLTLNGKDAGILKGDIKLEYKVKSKKKNKDCDDT